MIHTVNARARVVVSFYTALPLFQLQYRVLVLKLGRLRIYRWYTVRETELITPDHVSRCLSRAAAFLMSTRAKAKKQTQTLVTA